MDLSLVADQVGIGLSRFASTNHLSLADSPSDQYFAVLRISAAIFKSIARAPVKQNSYGVTNRLRLKRKRRVKKSGRSSDDDSGGDAGDYGFFGDSGGDGVFGDSVGGFFGGGGGRGWNRDGFGGDGWEDDEFSMFSDSGRACVWFKDVIVWIVIAGCLHFAIQRVFQIMEDGIGDGGREKVQPLC